MSLEVEVFPSGIMATNAYVFFNRSSLRGGVVDPALGCFDRIKDYISSNGISVECILLTHSHWDHIGDVKKLKDFYDIPVYIHPDDRGNLNNPGSDGLPINVKIDGVKHDVDLIGGKLDICGMKAEVIHTPGHTPGGVCIHFIDESVVFTGDILFKGAVGRVDFPTSSSDRMRDSVAGLASLPGSTVVYPGHGGSTTIGEEKDLCKNAFMDFFD